MLDTTVAEESLDSIPVTGRSAPGHDAASSAQTVLRGARCLGWIAAMSALDTVLRYVGIDTEFIFALAVTAEIEALVAGSGVGVFAPALVALGHGVVLAVLVALWWRALHGRAWALGLGLALYALDGTLFSYRGDWASAGFHLVFGVFLARGWIASLRRRDPPGAAGAGASPLPILLDGR